MIVPVAKVSRLTAQAVSEALSLGDEVVAVTVAIAPIETTRDRSADGPAATRDHTEHRRVGGPASTTGKAATPGCR